MADLTITAASVRMQSTSAVDRAGTAAQATTAGQVVYRATDGRWTLADSNAVAPEARIVKGIALNNTASADQPLVVLTGGDIIIGATLTAGSAYFLSETLGGIQPEDDLATGETVAPIGWAESTTVLNVRPVETGVVL